jgi:DNA-binding PadR family transcriptional regulator
MQDEQIHSFIVELRRGSLILAVLGCLKQAHYGYALLQTLGDKHIEIEANTLYPLLRRLDKQGLLVSEWNTSESRPRKYYVISEQGKEVFDILLIEWNAMQDSIKAICQEEMGNE